MGAKKKPNAKDAVEDTSTKEFLREYKKSCVQFETPSFKPLEKKLVEVMEEGDSKLPEILVNERIGENGAKAIANGLRMANKGTGYNHCQAIRIWDGDIGNEGVKAFYQFITDTNKTQIALLEFLNCNIEALGKYL